MLHTPESRAMWNSMPVPTRGASERNKGTAWRCMFAPIRARLASSFSRNGMRPAATDTSCDGDTSISVMSSGFCIVVSPADRHCTKFSVNLPVLGSTGAFAWAMTWGSSCNAVKYSTSLTTAPSLTLR